MELASSGTGTGAIRPDRVTHAFALNDARWAFGILEVDDGTGKIVENRCFRMSPGWYAVTLAESSPLCERPDDAAFRRTYPAYPGPWGVAKGHVLGLARIGYALPHAHCAINEWASDAYPVGNIITEVLPFGTPGPKVRANFGVFPLKAAQEPTRTRASERVAVGARRKTHAQDALPDIPDIWKSTPVRPTKPKAKAAATGEARQAVTTTGAKRSAEAARQGKAADGGADAAQPSAGTPASSPAKRAKAAVRRVCPVRRFPPKAKAKTAPAVLSPSCARSGSYASLSIA